MGDQPNWARRQKCDTLVFAGAQAGVCAASGTHDHDGGGNLVVPMEARANGQTHWRRRARCDGMTFGGGMTPSGRAAGGVRGDSASGRYWMFLTADPLPQGLRAGHGRSTCDAAARAAKAADEG